MESPTIEFLCFLIQSALEKKQNGRNYIFYIEPNPLHASIYKIASHTPLLAPSRLLHSLLPSAPNLISNLEPASVSLGLISWLISASILWRRPVVRMNSTQVFGPHTRRFPFPHLKVSKRVKFPSTMRWAGLTDCTYTYTFF